MMSMQAFPGCLLVSLATFDSQPVEGFQFASVFGDHMVLQCEQTLPVWGTAPAGSRWMVAVAGREALAIADEDGRWEFELPALPPGGPHLMEASGPDGVVQRYQDVWLGEVWLGAGQSNMAWPMNLTDGFVEEKERLDRAGADGQPFRIRMLTPSTGPAKQPATELTATWEICDGQSLGEASGLLYYFARELEARLDRPIGLINASLGGSRIESWIRLEAQLASPLLRADVLDDVVRYEAFDREKSLRAYEHRLGLWREMKQRGMRVEKPIHPVERHLREGWPGGLFNSYIAPLIPFRLRGVLWYQGEGNSGLCSAPRYEVQLPLLVRDWRDCWGEELPFAWVQLPSYQPPRGMGDWPTIRDAMRRSLRVPRTGMAITIDLGEPGDIHPRNKRDVARRLAGWALGDVYGYESMTSGPLPATFHVDNREFVVRFEHTQGELVCPNRTVEGLELRDERGCWFPAVGVIEGSMVRVTSPEVAVPCGVRYGWSCLPTASLYGAGGWPASPFQLP